MILEVSAAWHVIMKGFMAQAVCRPISQTCFNWNEKGHLYSLWAVDDAGIDGGGPHGPRGKLHFDDRQLTQIM